MDHSGFYKYLTSEGAIATLQTGKMRFSSHRLFNDPFEFKFHVSVPDTYDKIVRKILDDVLNEYTPEEKVRVLSSGMDSALASAEQIFLNEFPDKVRIIEKQLNDFFANHFVYCLSKARSNILMWSHYADGHQGAVLHFKPTDINSFETAKKVEYSSELRGIITEEDWLVMIGDSFERNSRLKSLHQKIVFTKARDWEYEKEWRMFVSIPSQKEGENYAFLEFDPLSVSEVHLGSKMTPENKNQILELTKQKYPNAKILQASTSTRSFDIELRELN